MADNITIPASGVGTALPVIATDDVGGVHYQYVKLIDATADSSSILFPAPATKIADGQNPSVSAVASLNFLKPYGSNVWDRASSIADGIDSVGSGIAATGIMAQLDDASTGTVTENQFSTLRMSSRRALLVEGMATGYPFPVSGILTTVSTVTAVTDITNWGNIVDNAGFTDGTTRILMGGYIFDETAGTALTENDGAAARIDSKRAQVIVLEDGTTRGLRVGIVDETGASAVDAQAVGGGTPHDAVNSGNPLLLGTEAVAHGSSPTAVAAADRTKLFSNRHGIPFYLGGHPNISSFRVNYTSAQTDTAIITQGAGGKFVITQAQITADNANSTAPSVIVGFGASTTPTGSGVIITHPGLPGGGGVSRGDGTGILAVGADGDDIRITTGTITGGSISVLLTYFIIES